MELWTYMGSLLGLLAFIQGVMPPEFRYMLSRFGRFLFEYLSFYNYFDIYEFEGMNSNELYSCVQLHLSSSASTAAHRATLSRPKNSNKITFGLARSECVTETFREAQVWWQHIITERPAQFSLWERSSDERRHYTLKIRKQDRERVLSAYLEYILEHAKELQHGNRDKLLYTNAKNSYNFHRQPWESVPFKHPSTFATLALDPLKKQEIMEDLTEFMKGEDFYHRVGRAWKRGYLLYGPPGTGKSSMIAAIANFTGYDVYDMELTEVVSNADLRKLLIKTTNKSIIVIEDIDCSLNLSDRKKKEKKMGENPMMMPTPKMDDEPSRVTLSGLLNFTDGLWSCCGSERIIVFTTNHIDKLDPALLRSGRMDMHISMSYCTFPAFKILGTNYLGLYDHELYEEIEQVVEDAKVTPAEVSEILIKKKKFPTDALESLLEALEAARDIKQLKKGAEAIEESQEFSDLKDESKPSDKSEACQEKPLSSSSSS